MVISELLNMAGKTFIVIKSSSSIKILMIPDPRLAFVPTIMWCLCIY